MAAGNSVWDEIREQNAKMKGQPFKKKFAYFWEYYKIPTLVVIVVIAVVVNITYTLVTAKDTVLYVIWANGYTEMDNEAYSDGIDEYLGLDTEQYESYVETNFTLETEASDEYAIAYLEKFVAMIAAEQLDVFVGNSDIFLGYAGNEYMADLTEVLSEEQLEKYADRLIYCDVVIEDDEDGNPIETEYTCVGVDVTDCAVLQETYAYAGYDAVYFGIIINSNQMENAAVYLDYMFEEGTVPVEED